MNVLLVEDEAAIRDALAAFLRIKGHRVTTAASREEGLAKIASADLDLLITDWRIGGGDGGALVVACACPAIVVSGAPEEVGELGERVLVLRKPVPPAELLRAVELLASGRTNETGQTPFVRTLEALPCDARDRLLLALALAGADPAAAEVTDDGVHATLEAPLPHGDAALRDLEKLGGDLQVRAAGAGGLRFVLRIFRDSRPDDVDVVLPLGADWPACQSLAVDCHGAGPGRLHELLAALRRARRRPAGEVTFLNVHPAWRLWLEIVDRPGDMPKRRPAGPRLPEFLSMLWS